MDFTKLISRRSYEKIALQKGYRDVRTMPFSQLEQIAKDAHTEVIANYWRSVKQRNDIPASAVAADDIDAAANRLSIPAYVYEDDADVIEAVCDRCEGNAYLIALVGDSEKLCECHRCRGNGYVLDVEDKRILESEPNFPPFKVAA